MVVEALARHPGVLRYTSDSGYRYELVTPEFIKQVDENGIPFIAQLGEAPVTHEHPTTLIRADSAGEEYYETTLRTDSGPVEVIDRVDDQSGRVVGQVQPLVKVYRSGRVKVLMDVEDPLTQEAIRKGEKRGVSMGYACGVIRKDGEWNGLHHTHQQVAPIKIDHLAIVANPRAPEALITRFDAADVDGDVAWAYAEDQVLLPIHTIRLDGCGCDSGNCGCEKCKKKRKEKRGDSMTIAPEHIGASVVLGGQSRRIDHELFEALRQDGLIDEVRLDDSAFWADMTFIEALHADGLIEPVLHEDRLVAGQQCGRGWVGKKPGCKRAKKGTAAKVRRVQEKRKAKQTTAARKRAGQASGRTKARKRSEADFLAQDPAAMKSLRRKLGKEFSKTRNMPGSEGYRPMDPQSLKRVGQLSALQRRAKARRK